jgi:hypothetical protein
MPYTHFIEASGALGSIMNDLATKADDKVFKTPEEKEDFKSTADTISGYAQAGKEVLDTVGNSEFLKYSDRPKSIIGRARNTILQFPVYVDDQLPTTFAHIVSKTFERVLASFTQSALAQHPVINAGDENGAKFLRQFHTNITEATKVIDQLHEDDIDVLDGIFKETMVGMQVTGEGVAVFRMIEATDEIKKESLRLMSSPLTGFSHYFEDAEDVPAGTDGLPKTGLQQVDPLDLAEKDFKSFLKDLPKDPGPKPNPGATPRQGPNEPDNEFHDRYEQWEREYQKALGDWKIDKQERDKRVAQIDSNRVAFNRKYEAIMAYGGLDGYVKTKEEEAIKKHGSIEAYNKAMEEAILLKYPTKYQNTPDVRKEIRDSRFKTAEELKRLYPSAPYKVQEINGRYYIPKVRDRDENIRPADPIVRPNISAPVLNTSNVTKINSMDPYMMTAEFLVSNRPGHAPYKVQYSVGVKTVLYPVPVRELSGDMEDVMIGDNKTLRFLKFKTGEMKTAEFLFNVAGIRKDVANTAGGKWVNRLKKLASSQTLLDEFRKKNKIPNATLVLSSTSVELIKSETGYDIKEPGIARKLAERLALIALGIVDITAGTMEVMFPDIDGRWDVQSISSIQAEVNRAENSGIMKELQKIATKIN